MTRYIRPLPITIVTMGLLAAVKVTGLVHALDVAPAARANTPAAPHPAPAAAAHASNPPASAADDKSATPTTPQPQPIIPAEPPISEAEKATLQDLRARRVQLDGRTQALDAREAMISAAERRLSERVEQLSALQAKLEQLDKSRREHDEANWKGLVKTYEAMRPRDAAAIFNDLDQSVLIPVLDRMKEAKAAPILAAMQTDRARAATAELAEWRNRSTASPTIDAASGGK